MAEKKMKEAIELKKGYQLAMRQANREEARVYREVFPRELWLSVISSYDML